jgi:branched-chain amino acid transport system ATP-binding protein
MLRVEEIVCRYGSIQALHGVSLDVKERELIGLVGANGAGKSTLLRAISGLVSPVEGAIYFQGERIEGLRASSIVRRRIAHCPEERKLWPYLSVEDNLMLGAYVRKDWKEIEKDVNWVYDMFPVLRERRNQLGGTLSGGEQQMVALGRALMLRPQLLLMDEPTLGLGPIIVETLTEIIRNIHHEGKTVLLVEQNAFLALELSDRAYVMETGQIVKEGLGRDLVNDPYVKDAYLGGKTLKDRSRAKKSAR